METAMQSPNPSLEGKPEIDTTIQRMNPNVKK